MGRLVVQAEHLLQPLKRTQHQHRHAQAGGDEHKAGGHDDVARREHEAGVPGSDAVPLCMARPKTR